MASYRYEREIDPADLVPEPQRQYTRKERWKNWWDYNLKWVILGVLAALTVFGFLGQATTGVKPDYNVAVVAPGALPEDTIAALQTGLAQYGEDLNGDGKVTVTVNSYVIDYSGDSVETSLSMANATKLAGDFSTGTSSVFLLYDPAGFEENTSALRYLDGTLPELNSDDDWWDMVYRWTDCPVLTGLDLGEYAVDAGHTQSGDSQELLSGFYVGIRGAWDDKTAEALQGSDAFWQALTAGAVSTVEAEG